MRWRERAWSITSNNPTFLFFPTWNSVPDICSKREWTRRIFRMSALKMAVHTPRLIFLDENWHKCALPHGQHMVTSAAWYGTPTRHTAYLGGGTFCGKFGFRAYFWLLWANYCRNRETDTGRWKTMFFHPSMPVFNFLTLFYGSLPLYTQNRGKKVHFRAVTVHTPTLGVHISATNGPRGSSGVPFWSARSIFSAHQVTWKNKDPPFFDVATWGSNLSESAS